MLKLLFGINIAHIDGNNQYLYLIPIFIMLNSIAEPVSAFNVSLLPDNYTAFSDFCHEYNDPSACDAPLNDIPDRRGNTRIDRPAQKNRPLLFYIPSEQSLVIRIPSPGSELDPGVSSSTELSNTPRIYIRTGMPSGATGSSKNTLSSNSKVYNFDINRSLDYLLTSSFGWNQSWEFTGQLIMPTMGASPPPFSVPFKLIDLVSPPIHTPKP